MRWSEDALKEERKKYVSRVGRLLLHVLLTIARTLLMNDFDYPIFLDKIFAVPQCQFNFNHLEPTNNTRILSDTLIDYIF